MTLLGLVVAIVVLVAFALLAHWLITKFITSEPARTIALMVVGLILLIILLSRLFPSVGAFKVW